MAENVSIFNKNATEKLRSPDDLEKYVRVTTPSVWVIVFACATLFAGLLAWGIFGTVSTNVAATGAVINGKPLCFLEASDVASIKEGDSVSFSGVHMKVAKIDAVPLSREEAKNVLHSDYLVSSLIAGDWGYQVTFDGDASGLTADVPLMVSITTERIAPISLILENRG